MKQLGGEAGRKRELINDTNFAAATTVIVYKATRSMHFTLHE